MTNDKHKYGPFNKNQDNFYRVCLKCGKKSQYPATDDIVIEYNKQRVTDYMIDIITKKDFNSIKDENNFLMLVASLLDNISYIYLDNEKQGKLVSSLRELNAYINGNDYERHRLIEDTVCYIKDFFDNYNNEIKDIYDDDLVESLDDRYTGLSNSYDISIVDININEDEYLSSKKRMH